MKVTPVSQGSGVPAGASIGQERMPADRIAAAKAIAMGQSPMKMTPSDTPVEEAARRERRTLKMRTNASPERYLESQPEPAPEAQSAIPDTVGTTSAVTEATQPLSPQLAAIAKQRRALQVKERELTEREKAFKEREQPPGQTSDSLIARLKSEPLSVLQEHGVTYDQLTEAILSGNSGVTPEIRQLQAELKALKEGVDKNFTDREAAQEAAVVAEMRKEAESLIKEGEDFELVRQTKSLDDVMNLILRTYKKTGEIMEVPEALGLIEEELIKDVLPIARANKVQNKLRPPESYALPTAQPQPEKILRTLTNRDSASVPLDRKTRAMRAFHGLT
jgi:hypothetical protein